MHSVVCRCRLSLELLCSSGGLLDYKLLLNLRTLGRDHPLINPDDVPSSEVEPKKMLAADGKLHFTKIRYPGASTLRIFHHPVLTSQKKFSKTIPNQSREAGKKESRLVVYVPPAFHAI